jgi:general secretion pathway protein D
MDTKSSYGVRFSRKALLATAASCLLAAVFHAPATLAQKLPGVGAELSEAMEKRLAQVDSSELSHAAKLGRFVESEYMRKLEQQGGGALKPSGPVKVGTALAQPLAATVLTTVKAGNSAEGADDEESVVLNFEGADIREVIFALASSLGINYWIDPRVAGQVTVRTTGRISRADLMPVFHQVLRNNGFVAVLEGDIHSIVPAEEGRTRVRAGKGTKQGGFVMELVKVHHVNAEELVTVLQPFVSPGGDVVAYPRSNLVIITELASRADRLLELLRTFDTDTFGDLSARIYHIEHASLEEVAEDLWAVLESYQVSSSGAGVYIIPLLRLNSLAVIAFDPSIFVNVELWLGLLDVPAEGGSIRQVHVYQVENTKAVDLSDILNDIFSEEGGLDGRRRSRSGELAESNAGLGGGLGSSAQSRQVRGGDRRGGSRKGQPGGTPRGRTNISGGLGQDSVLERPGALFEQEVRIVADEVTNSLVIIATPRDYSTVESVLRQLDVVPRQVLIEVLIAEITLGEAMSFGFTQKLSGNNDPSTGSSTVDPGGSFLDMFGEAVRLTGDLGGSGATGVFTKFRGSMAVYEATLKALAKENRLKVLSRPQIMTADNKEASILVGNEVPIITSQVDSNTAVGGSTGTRNEVQYRDTGIIVRVLPQVNSQGLVNLTISQEVSAIDQPALQVGSGDDTSTVINSPTFITRKAETTVVVQSGETVVIAGIIDEKETTSESGVPFLKDLPFFGQFFRDQSSEISRTELVILITPYVVRDREEARLVSEDYKERVEYLMGEPNLFGPKDLGGSHTVILGG